MGVKDYRVSELSPRVMMRAVSRPVYIEGGERRPVNLELLNLDYYK